MSKTKEKKPEYLSKIIKEYGNIISNGMDVLEEKKNYKIISISPAIDIALGGGVKEGSWLTLTGDPKSGKTTTAMQIAANCQKEGRPIIYLDAEGRLKDMNFEVHDLDPDKMKIVHPEDKPLPAEDFLDVAHKLMSHPDYYGAVLIIDSISALIPKKELDGDFSPGRAGLPKILSIFTKKMGQLLPRQRGLIIAITHFIANTGGFGKAKMSDGGNKIQYQADTRMEIAGGGEKISAVTPWVNTNKERIGQVLNWKIICSSMGAPGGQVQSWLRYGHGIDKTQEVLMLAQDLGMIEKAGAWATCTFMLEHKELAKEINPTLNIEDDEAILKAFKFQGQDKLYGFIADNPKLVSLLEQEIKEML
jgi:recombination protein RecA